MSKASYKKARSTINRLLSDLMDGESDDDIPSVKGTPPINQQPSYSQPPYPMRSSSAPPFGLFGSSTPSMSEQYQWFMGQYEQHPLQQMRPPPLLQIMPKTNSAAAATGHHHTYPSAATGYAAQVPRDQPSPTQSSDNCCSDCIFGCDYYVPLLPYAIILIIKMI